MCSLECEVLLPLIAPRMEQVLDLTCVRIDPAQIRPFVKITPMTCQREITYVVAAAVFPGNDVLDVMQDFAVALVQQTVFTSFAGPFPHKPADTGINH
jgi:hypothetical protein